ncbi:MAG: penicillin-binding protein 2, partial [Patescibacteria group bacterium]|nr:penicillin-binding protein 2 [Patescibacteria group bacterium]
MAAQDYLVSKVQKKRIQLVGILFFFASLIVLLKLGYIQIFKHNYYVIAASKQHYAFDNIPAKRGLIYVKDTDSGKLYPLAENIYQDMVFVSPKEVTSKEEAIIKLADILKKDREEIRSLFDSSETYVAIEHRLTDEQSQKIKNLNIKGVYLNKEEWRYYPENSLLSQALGYVDDEGNGQYGIEESYNDILKGVPGIYKAESDTGGQKIAFGRDVSKEAIDGKGIVLTINRDIQAEAEKILAEGVKKFGAEGGSIIVMEPKTGKILAMTSKPDFNPNDYKNEKNYELFKNKTITDTYEPGSIFKAITMSAGIDTGKVSPETEYEDAGQVVLNGHKIMNSDKKANGKQTMTQVLEKSLNTGVIFVLNKIGQSTFFDYVKRKFGFGERTGISLIGEASGQVLSEDEKEHTVATMTFGQSILTTPLQMINAFAAIANGGVIMRPQIIEKIIDKDGKEEEKQPEIGRA